jgi:hypothetical protein
MFSSCCVGKDLRGEQGGYDSASISLGADCPGLCGFHKAYAYIYMEKGLGAMTISRVRDAFYVGIMQANLSYREAPIGNIHLVFFCCTVPYRVCNSSNFGDKLG